MRIRYLHHRHRLWSVVWTDTQSLSEGQFQYYSGARVSDLKAVVGRFCAFATRLGPQVNRGTMRFRQMKAEVVNVEVSALVT
jgi:hypothetical protein